MNLLTNEQIAYLKSLDSKKKRRKFFLDCLVENVIGESEKNNQDALVGIQKLSNLPRYLFPHEMEQIQRLNPSFTNTTAPRTFEGIDEESKWDKNPKLEDIIKSKLIIRGFKNEDLLNNRGLIGATIDETVIEVVKNYPFANENTEAKFTKEDMTRCFNESRLEKFPTGEYLAEIKHAKYRNFDDYLKSIENDKSAN